VCLFLRPRVETEQRLARVTAGVAVAIGILAMLQAAERPAVRSMHFEIDGVPRYRIVQLADLHIGPTLGRSFAEDVAQRTNAVQPDLIVVSGDMVDGSVAELASEVAPLKNLRAADGVVFVLGNHEYLSDADAWVRHARSFGWHVLRDERLELPRLDVIGFDEFSDPEADIYAALSSRGRHRKLPDLSARRPTITVGHSPQSFAAACDAGVDLALAGHTHGGQIFPFGILERLQQGYLAGNYSCGHTQLLVSPGAGYWGPPMRLGSRAEISVLELASAARRASPSRVAAKECSHGRQAVVSVERLAKPRSGERVFRRYAAHTVTTEQQPRPSAVATFCRRYAAAEWRDHASTGL